MSVMAREIMVIFVAVDVSLRRGVTTNTGMFIKIIKMASSHMNAIATELASAGSSEN